MSDDFEIRMLRNHLKARSAAMSEKVERLKFDQIPTASSRWVSEEDYDALATKLASRDALIDRQAKVIQAAKQESLIRRAMDSATDNCDQKAWWTLHDEHVEALEVLDAALAALDRESGT